MRLFNRATLARHLGVTPSRVTAIQKQGQIHAPITDEDTGREGWPTASVQHLAAQRSGRNASPALASLPEATEPLPIIARHVVRYSHQLEALADGDITGHAALATASQSARGPVVLLQPLAPGSSVPNHPAVLSPVSSMMRPETDAELVSLTANAAAALGLDPFATRWLLLSHDTAAFSLDPEALQEIVVEALATRKPFQRRWPHTATLHTIPSAVVASRLGEAPGIIPASARSVPMVEGWAAAGWSEDHLAQVDVDGSVRLASTASLLHGLAGDDALPVLAGLIAAQVEHHQAGPVPTDFYDDEEQLPDGARPLPQLAYAETPTITAPASADTTPTPEAIKAELDRAQRLLDFTFTPGVRPDPVMAQALRAAITHGADALPHDLNTPRYQPSRAWFVRHLRADQIPPAASQTFPGTPDAKLLAILRAATTTAPGITHAHAGTVAGFPALLAPAPDAADPGTVHLLAPGLAGALADDPTAFADWSAIHVHHDTQDGVAWVETPTGWRIMPMARDEPMTTGYNGTGPSNTFDMIHAFLKWVHGTELQTEDTEFIRYRLTGDTSPFVTIRRDMLLHL